MNLSKGQGFERAEAYKEAVEELWTRPIFESSTELIPRVGEGSVLVAEARCGFVPLELVERGDTGGRIIAMDENDAMLDAARRRLESAHSERSIYFVDQKVGDISYADSVFQASLCLDGVYTLDEAERALNELARVTAPEGQILLAAPLETSFPEFYDILDEALREHQILEEVRPRLKELREALCTPADLLRAARVAAIFDVRIDELTWRVAFGGGYEFLHSPLIREMFFSQWIELIPSADRAPILRYISDAIDTYWHGRPFLATIRAATVSGEVGALTVPA